MDSLRNLPIYLRYEANGTVAAYCPLLPECHCTATSRDRALDTMQKLIRQAFTASALTEPQKGQEYEVVYLAVVPSEDSVNRFSDRIPQYSKVECARLEIL